MKSISIVLAATLLATTSGFAVSSRRDACKAAAAFSSFAALSPVQPALAGGEKKEITLVKATSAQLKELLEKKEAFIAAYAAGEASAPQLPAPIPFTTFQALEKTSDPEFMEAAIDYAEAFRGAKDLVKLAKLTKSTVIVSTKEPGKPAVKVEMSYGDAPGSNLGSAEEYAKRATEEILGASVALDAAISYMK